LDFKEFQTAAPGAKRGGAVSFESMTDVGRFSHAGRSIAGSGEWVANQAQQESRTIAPDPLAAI
jgi:hypothetical protein